MSGRARVSSVFAEAFGADKADSIEEAFIQTGADVTVLEAEKYRDELIAAKAKAEKPKPKHKAHAK